MASYIGRFAPSPSGPLHFGSLLAALASFLDARASGGSWLLRMEDLDPPRQPPGAADTILRQLENLGLHWDGPVLYQSSRRDAHLEVLAQLAEAGLCYACSCSRARLRELQHLYDGRCRSNTLSPAQCTSEPTAQEPNQQGYAIRFHTGSGNINFDDLIQGPCSRDLRQQAGDFVLRRKDGHIAYQLAVVVDDGYQNISHVLRGADLLHSTAWQIHLQQTLGLPRPVYAHIPLATDARGEKLSKQHLAPAITPEHSGGALRQALRALGQALPEEASAASTAELLQWAVSHWDISAVPRRSKLLPAQDTAIIGTMDNARGAMKGSGDGWKPIRCPPYDCWEPSKNRNSRGEAE